MILEIELPAIPEGYRWLYKEDTRHEEWDRICLQKATEFTTGWRKIPGREWRNVLEMPIHVVDRLNPREHREVAVRVLDEWKRKKEKEEALSTKIIYTWASPDR